MPRRDLVFRVFVSSTFRDLSAERNALQQHVYPRLCAYCVQRGARFQAVDLRWGVSEEASLDQQTMNVCLQELKRCQQASPRPNFIVLLGERYGWLPLPPQIPASEFELLLEQVDPAQRGVLRWEEGQRPAEKGWYRKDDNAIPAEYVLQPRRVFLEEGSSDETQRATRAMEALQWGQTERMLHRLLREAARRLWPAGRPQRERYEESATHQEIRSGALQVDDAASHVFCYFRHIEGLPEDDRAAAFRDRDRESQARLALIRDELRKVLPSERIYEYRAAWNGSEPQADLDALCSRVEDDLKSIIDAELAAFTRETELDREIDAHDEFRKVHVRQFVGRSETLDRMREYVFGSSHRPLIVCGVSGAGKTAVMAKAADELVVGSSGHVVVSRFLGVTPASSDLRSVLEGLCRQIARAYGDALEEGAMGDIREVILEFRKRLAMGTAERPLVVFLDALDQLTTAYEAHSLGWLPSTLPKHSRLIISAVESDERPGDCCRAARSRFLSGDFQPVGPLSPQDGARLLDAWFAGARCLQPCQRVDVLTKFERNGLPLYLQLAFEEARRWKSYDGLPHRDRSTPGLSADIPGVLDDLFDRLMEERNHGAILTSRALSYLALGRNGLTEDELIAVLSLDADVQDDFRRRSPNSPPVNALPAVVWARLHAEIEPYLGRRRDGASLVLVFYHRQLQNAIARRWLSDGSRRNQSRLLATHFTALGLEDRRALIELPFHLAQAEQPEETARLLCDLTYLDARCRQCDVHDLVRDYGLLPEITGGSAAWQAFLRRHAQQLGHHRGMLFSLVWHEGFPEARTEAERLIAEGRWSRPWLRTERALPSMPRMAKGETTELIVRHRFPSSAAVDLAPQRELAFVFERIGKIGMVDTRQGLLLPTFVLTRPFRPLVLSAAPDGNHLVVAFEDGTAELLELTYDPSGMLIGQYERGTFRYLLPEVDDPVFAWEPSGLWYQADSGTLARLDLAQPQASPHLLAIPMDLGGELSGAILLPDRLVVAFRCGHDTRIAAFQGDKLAGRLAFPGVNVACLCGCREHRVAVALESRRLVILDVGTSLQTMRETTVDERPLCLVWHGNAYVWVSERGSVFLWRPDERQPIMIAQRQLLFGTDAEHGRRIAVTENHELVVVTSSQVLSFRIRSDGTAGNDPIRVVFAPKPRQAYVVQERDEGLCVIDIAAERRQFVLHDDNRWPQFAVDGCGHLLAVQLSGQGVLLEIPTDRRRELRALPPEVSATCGDPRGGFWLADRFGKVYFVSDRGDCMFMCRLPLESPSCIELRRIAETLIWYGIAEHAGAGASTGSALETMVLWRIESLRPPRAISIGQRIFDRTEGWHGGLAYDHHRGLLLLARQRAAQFASSVMVGSPTDFVYRRERHHEIAGLTGSFVRAVAMPEDRGLYLLSDTGDLFRLALSSFAVEAVLSLTVPWFRMAIDSTEGKDLLLADANHQLFYCHLEAQS